MTPAVLVRFERKVQRSGDGCWIWTGAKNSRGYGQLKIDGRSRYAHRLAYEHWQGLIPEGFELDHLCRTRACVNPAHLEPVTRRARTSVAVKASAA